MINILISHMMFASINAALFSVLTLLVGRQEEHLACKNWVMRCWSGYLYGAT